MTEIALYTQIATPGSVVYIMLRTGIVLIHQDSVIELQCVQETQTHERSNSRVYILYMVRFIKEVGGCKLAQNKNCVVHTKPSSTINGI
jgi:hypothetical protein